MSYQVTMILGTQQTCVRYSSQEQAEQFAKQQRDIGYWTRVVVEML